MTLDVLVDYDNLLPLDRSRGLTSVVTKIISAFTSNELQGITNVKIRLYGGWYRGGSPTRKSQDLSIDIASNFPKVVTSPTTGIRFIVAIELAYSLLITPREHLLNTYRIRSFPEDISCIDPTQTGCTESSCPIQHIHTFLTQGMCGHHNCTKEPKDILYRGAQKMVDTMLTADLFYLSMHSSDPLVIVSSDDDFWPGIRSVLELGNRVIQVQTRPYRSLSTLYKQYVSLNYIEKNI